MYEHDIKVNSTQACETAKNETKLEEALTRLSYMQDEVTSLDVGLHRIKSDLVGDVPECNEKEASSLAEPGKLGELGDSISSIEKKLRSMRETIHYIQTLV